MKRITEITKFIKKIKSTQPYHNLRHIHGMHGIAVMLLNTINVTDSERFILDHICLFHDLGHTAGVEKDGVNIALACTLFDGYCLQDNGYIITADQAVIVKRGIRCTQFPFVNPPQSYVEYCVRDADVLYAMFHSDPAIVLEALRSEINESYHPEPVSVEQMVEGQREFMDNLDMFTSMGHTLMHQQKELFYSKLLAYV